jgi:hypothetical protein
MVITDPAEFVAELHDSASLGSVSRLSGDDAADTATRLIDIPTAARNEMNVLIGCPTKRRCARYAHAWSVHSAE